MRVQSLRKALYDNKLDGYFCIDEHNRRYLSGFDGSFGALFITESAKVLLTDFRYALQAQRQSPGFEIVQCAPLELYEMVAKLAARHKVKSLGFEESRMTVSDYEQALELLKRPTKLHKAQALATGLRRVKDAGEIELIRKAAAIADEAFAHMCSFMKEGMSEREVALELNFRMLSRSDALSFGTIVASGPNSALPHAKPSDRKLQALDAVVMDFGCVIDGYHSDMTRTVFISGIDNEMGRVYNIVRNAQSEALLAIKAGADGRAIHEVAAGIIAAEGYGERFGHGLGHGVGLEVHEAPRLSPTSSDVLEENMAVTCEPGIYLPGVGGVRIEDLVIVKQDGLDNLVVSSKEPIVI